MESQNQQHLTYLIGHYNTSSQDYGLASYITHVMCVNFIPEWQDLQFNVDSTPNDIFLKNFFMAGLFYSQSFCQKSAERKMPFFHTSF